MLLQSVPRCAKMPPPIPHAASVVFVVDDDISVREALQALIRQAGWQAEPFASARDFLDHPRDAVPSCLVLDVSLPDLSGLELQSRITSDPVAVTRSISSVPTVARRASPK